MRPSKLIAGLEARASVVATLLVAVSLVACAAAFAQSGRRNPKQQPVAPVPTPTPEPTPLPQDDKVGQRIPLHVLIDDAGGFQLMPSETDTVHGVTVARLRESRALEVSAGDRRASRGEAIKQAKESKDRHVVWLELRPDAFMDRRTQRPSPENFRIDYTVFAPVTAKRETSGTVHLQRVYGPLGRVGLPSCYPNRTYEVEYAYGALETAERIMQSFSLAIPRRCS